MQVACIGLGNIGSGVAANVLSADYRLVVADLDPQRVADAVALGAIAAASAGDAVQGADVVFTSLPGPTQIVEVCRQILPAMKPGSTWVDLSTNDLDTARKIRNDAAAAGVFVVDAPVSGGPEGAAAGTLSLFVGGHPQDVERVMPLLQAIGAKIDHLGPHGAGVVAKIAQVTLCYTQTVTLIEALVLGVKGGVEPAKMLDLIQNSAGSSYCATTYGPEILAGTYDASFPIGHAAKDMRLAMDLASSVNAELPFTASVAALYEEAQQEYGSAAAHCLAAQLIERRNETIVHELVNGSSSATGENQ